MLTPATRHASNGAVSWSHSSDATSEAAIRDEFHNAMKRWKQFYLNAGFSGVARTVIGSLIAIVLLGAAFEAGDGYYATAASVAGVFIAYILNETITDHLRATKYMMNGSLSCFLIGLWSVPNFYEIPTVRTYAAAFVFTYLSCYFWIHSHPRVLAGWRLTAMQAARAAYENDDAVNSDEDGDEYDDDASRLPSPPHG